MAILESAILDPPSSIYLNSSALFNKRENEAS